MDDRRLRCVCLSDFNISNLAGYLSNDEDAPAVEATAAPYGQVITLLVSPDHEIWRPGTDLAVVWTRPEGVIAGFQRLLAGDDTDIAGILREVDAYSGHLLSLTDRVSSILVPMWTLRPTVFGSPLVEFDDKVGVPGTLMQMNLRLRDNLRTSPNVFVLNAERWISVTGATAYNAKSWYMAKIPFGPAVFKEATRDIKRSLRALHGNSRKLLILDLDNTLWGGVVGDDGWQNVTLGGHNPVGEAYADFQSALQGLSRRGVLLAVVSKNEETVALEAIRNHPEMVLRLEDFVGWRINWDDKAKNVADLTQDLNLGLQSVVFIDDNPVERDRVRNALPEVLVPDWPADAMLYRQALENLPCFDFISISEEDRQRTRLYSSERQRQEIKMQTATLDDWLASLNICVQVDVLSDTNLPRVTQLLNKTNQMNLTTRRISENELRSWAADPSRRVWAVRVSDKFGDLGLTGVVSLEHEADRGRIVDFVLSCRAMGRKVEESLLRIVIDYARAASLKHVYAVYVPTEKNKPCLDFWLRSGFTNDEQHSFRWETALPYPSVTHVAVDDCTLAS